MITSKTVSTNQLFSQVFKLKKKENIGVDLHYVDYSLPEGFGS